MIHENFSVDGSPDIEIRLEAGRVEVHRGEPGSVEVTVDTKAADFVVEQRGNSILVSSDKTTPWLSRGSAYLMIRAPDGADLRMAVASAAVRADLPLGKVDIKTASGDIELESVENLVIKTASGDAEVASVDHALRFSSASGDLRVRESCHGSVAVSTASGDVHIEDSDASVNVSTASGDVRISRFTGSSASFKAMSGSVDLGIPRRSEVSLDVNLLSGKLRLPEPESSHDEPERQMSVRAKLVSGNLTINRV